MKVVALSKKKYNEDMNKLENLSIKVCGLQHKSLSPFHSPVIFFSIEVVEIYLKLTVVNYTTLR